MFRPTRQLFDDISPELPVCGIYDDQSMTTCGKAARTCP